MVLADDDKRININIRYTRCHNVQWTLGASGQCSNTENAVLNKRRASNPSV